jgi:LPS-assembly protein
MQRQRNKASAARFALRPVALVVAWLLHAPGAFAQVQPAPPAAEPSPQLKASPRLREDIPPDARAQLPTFVEGDRIGGQVDVETSVEGNAVLRRGDTVIRARRIDYHQADDLARAQGDVHVNKAGNIFEGPELQLHLDSFEGFFTNPHYQFLRNEGYGEAERMDFIDKDHSVVTRATYTTCKRKPGPSWMPDWILRASSISFDEQNDVGEAKNAVLRFKNVPILAIPDMTFPLSEKRKSGFLPPTIGVDNRSGVETTIPYYWNIAPNRDATLYPTLMTKRGVDLGAEFRYLEPDYNGFLRGDFLPHDKLSNSNRWGLTWQHTQPKLQLPYFGSGTVLLNMNRVSDDNYWKDFSRSSASLTQRLLSDDALLVTSWMGATLMARSLRWQTLQDLTAPIIPPYDRSPQVNLRKVATALPGGFDVTMEGDYSHFSHSVSSDLAALYPPTQTLVTQPNGRRSYLLAQVSRPWQAPGWFVVPKLQVNSRYYSFDSPTMSGQESATVTVPTASLDTGLVLERDTHLFGRNFVQTLEPRAFLVYTPFRNQNQLPNYESAVADFNFATVYTENEFSGWDRISDSRTLTVGTQSRLLDRDTGEEAARFGIAQRLRFADEHIGLLPTDPVISDRLSDTLFGASVALTRRWNATATREYNFKAHEAIRDVLGVRYNPRPYHVFNIAYRFQKDLSRDIDIGWQWPLNDLWGDRGQDLGPGRGEGEGRWYSVGRMDVSLMDPRRLVEGLLGLEYDGGCWIGRIVVERLQTGTTTANKRILFQLEFSGLSHLGSNALVTLKQNIPRYQYLREQTLPPSRFSNYE